MARDRRHANAEFAKGGWQHPPTYATAYSSFARKPLISSMVKRNTTVRACAITRRTFIFRVSPWALSGASRETEFRECAAFLFRAEAAAPGMSRRGKEGLWLSDPRQVQ